MADAQSAPQAPVTVTQRLGRFILLRKLGEGGMGTVFVAYDEPLDRRVAVKLLRRLDPEQRAHRVRVLREAQSMARVSHENVVHVYEVGEIGGQILIAMELVDGMPLSAWQRQEKHPWRELLGIYRQAADSGSWLRTTPGSCTATSNQTTYSSTTAGPAVARALRTLVWRGSIPALPAPTRRRSRSARRRRCRAP